MISISHSPNSNLKQQRLAASFFVFPWNWFKMRKGKDISLLENKISEIHGGGESIAFSAGRECLLAILKSLELKPGDEVIIQGYTCIVVPNAVIWSGAKPIYVDVDNTLNMNPELLESKITSKTKAIIVQHTFGVPADMNRISEVAKKNNLIIIEDCAHSLGAKVEDKLVGTIGDIAFFSFGRDKIISSVSGGAVYTRNKLLAKKIRVTQANSSNRSYLWIKQNLAHVLLVPWMARLIGKFKIGQALMFASQKLFVLNKVYTKKELCQQVSEKAFYKMPNAMAMLALQQLNNLENNLSHRKLLAEKYKDYCVKNNINFQAEYKNTTPAYLRFTVLVSDNKAVLKAAKNAGFILGNWYNKVIMPAPKDWSSINYKPEYCPESEKYTSLNVNLPTHWKIKNKHAEKILRLVK